MANMRTFRIDSRNVHLFQRVVSLASVSSREPLRAPCNSMFLCCSRRHVSHLTSTNPKLQISTLTPFNHNSLKRLIPVYESGNAQFHTTGSVTISGDSSTGNNNGKLDNGNNRADNSSNVDSLLETWFYEVCQYGSLTANIPFNTVIKPLNPQDYPDMNKVILQLHYDTPKPGSDIPPSHQLSQISGLYDLNVTFDDDRANMNLSFDLIQGLDLPLSCTLHVPLKFGLILKFSGEKSVFVEKMESDSVVIETESGDCNLHSMKCGSVSIVSKSGNIVCNSTLLGNTILHTGSFGRISMEKIQGSCVTCKTEMGLMSVRSLYTEAATFNTVFGNIHLGNCHGQVHVLGENCQVDIDSLDGDLDVALQNGSVNVLLSRHNRVDIDISTGDIGLSFPEGASTDLNLNCPTLTVAENLGAHFTETEMPLHKGGFIGQSGISQINARTQSGRISLRLLDWIATTKLAFKKEE